jgi:hypothetical protein
LENENGIRIIEEDFFHDLPVGFFSAKICVLNLRKSAGTFFASEELYRIFFYTKCYYLSGRMF